MINWKKIVCTILLLSPVFLIKAQQKDSSNNTSDSSITAFVKSLQKRGADETVRSIEKYKSGQLAIRQQQLIEEIKNYTQKAKIHLKNGIDTLAIANELKNTNTYLSIAGDGVFTNKADIQSQRNLAVTAAIYTELLDRITVRQNQISNYTKKLIDLRNKIDSLNADPALYKFPDDSLSTLKYIKKVIVVAREIGPTDSALTQSLASVQELQNQVDMVAFTIRTSMEDIEKYRRELTAVTFQRELVNLDDSKTSERSMSQIIDFSYAKEKLALRFYINDYEGRIIILFLLIILVTLFIRSLKKRLHTEAALVSDFKGQLALRHPFLSSIVIVSSLYQFVFIDPPFIFSFVLWSVSAISLSFIFRSYITRFWMIFWISMILLFFAASFDNMILQLSETERTWIVALAFIGAAYGIFLLLSKQRKELKEKSLIYFIAFVVLAESASIVTNYFGRYNLSKTLLISGYTGVIIAILFLWTVRMINEILGITSSTYKHADKKLFFINFEKLGDRVPVIFYYFLVAGWLILISRHSYAFKQIVTPFNEFLTSERTLGDYTFSINGLFIFLLILICSMLLSRLISFFASEPTSSEQDEHGSGKVSLGSWLLLIRILVISVGIFLAFAASGIPLDKITIILGALGVGIGLGLQGLVNNLVSGLIIAFEKPVNVGDTIEVNDKPGTMKSIGFRSSVVTMADGACLIIPNGDLLSQHLVNWTMGKNIKRLSITVGVAYGSDLEKVKLLVYDILKNDSRILKNPAPQVLAKEFNASSIDFEIFFWVYHGKDMPFAKSDVITQIDTVFKSEKIIIPMPQQEVTLHAPDSKTIPAAKN